MFVFGYDVPNVAGKDILEETLNAPNQVCFVFCNTTTNMQARTLL